MRKLALAVFFGAAVTVAGGVPADAAPTLLYGRVDAGGSFPTGSDMNGFDPSPMVGAGIGFSPLPFLRTDATVAYRTGYSGSATTNVLGTTFSAKSNIKTLTGMLNAYFDFPTVAGFTPYVGGGAGFARNDLGSTTFSAGGAQFAVVGGSTRTDFAWQVGGGVAISILPTIALDIGYHYLDAGKFETASSPLLGGSASGRVRAHEVQAGIRIGF